MILEVRFTHTIRLREALTLVVVTGLVSSFDDSMLPATDQLTDALPCVVVNAPPRRRFRLLAHAPPFGGVSIRLRHIFPCATLARMKGKCFVAPSTSLT